jgi:hypothetical protein
LFNVEGPKKPVNKKKEEDGVSGQAKGKIGWKSATNLNLNFVCQETQLHLALIPEFVPLMKGSCAQVSHSSGGLFIFMCLSLVLGVAVSLMAA